MGCQVKKPVWRRNRGVTIGGSGVSIGGGDGALGDKYQ